ncbi:hypothetical protein P3342_008692 [Pyrenophora teres f. teres]|nr:hypothetical protein P3342_008692 [Pyrenophora teres f. teres]
MPNKGSAVRVLVAVNKSSIIFSAIWTGLNGRKRLFGWSGPGSDLVGPFLPESSRAAAGPHFSTFSPRVTVLLHMDPKHERLSGHRARMILVTLERVDVT